MGHCLTRYLRGIGCKGDRMGVRERIVDHLVGEYGATPDRRGRVVLALDDGEGGSRSVVWEPRDSDVGELARRLGRSAKQAVGRGGIDGGTDLLLVLVDEELLTFEGGRGQLIVGPRQVHVRES
jgi:hypothetical protein